MNIEEQTQWKTPGDVMKKIRVRKKRKDVTRKSTFGNSSLVSSKITDATLATADASSVTRLNPYSCKRKSSEVNVVQKKRILSCSDYDNVAVAITQTENHSPLDSHLGSDEIKSKENMEPPLPPPKQNHFQMDVALQSLMLKSEAEKEGKIDNANKISENLPVDWTIKKKVRFLSQSPFTWCSRMKSAEEALCILKATRDYRSTTDEVQNAKTTDFDQKSWRIALGSFLTYWQHPCIPWLTLFPRFGLDQRIVHGKSTVSLSDEVVRALYDSWVIGFRSVYQMTQESLCPYFYILAQQYTAIFRASGVYGMNEIICILTPTTPGFRQSLKKEGIAFTMLREKKSKKIKDEIPSESADAEKVDQTKDVGEVDGISVNNTPSTNDSHTAATKDTNEKEEPEWEKIASELKFREHREILPPDNVSSAILIKGDSNTQLLFNYLLNSQSSITCSGHQTGVPPTIISPIAFQGASLQKLNIRAGVVKSFSESSFDRSKLTVTGTKKKFSMDISGPLLPDSFIKIADLLRRTQHNNGFFATFDTYSCTTPFNSSLVDNQQGGPNSNNNLNTESCEVINKNLAAALGPPCDLLESHLLKRSNEAITFHDLTLTENLFSWT